MTWHPRIGKLLAVAVFMSCLSFMILKNGECIKVEEQAFLNTSTAKVIGNLEVDRAEDGEVSTDTGLYIMSQMAPVDGYVNAVNACVFVKDSNSSPQIGDQITLYFYIAGYRLVGGKFKRVTDTLEFSEDVVNQTFCCHMIVFAVDQRQEVLKGDRLGVFVSDSECNQLLTHPPSYFCPAHPNIIDPIKNCSQSLYFSDARLTDYSMPNELNAFSGQPVDVFINLDIIFEPEHPHNQEPPSRVCASKVTFQRTPHITAIISVIVVGMLALFLLVIVILACTIVYRNKRKVRQLKESIRRPDQSRDHQIDLHLSNVCYNEYDTSNKNTRSQSTKNHLQLDLLKSNHSYMISSLASLNMIADRDEELYWQPAIIEEGLKHQLQKLKVDEVPKNAIEVKEYLGSGRFGIVYRGLLTVNEVHSETGVKEVAVKTMENGATEEQRIKFLQEAVTMGQFDNPYIVKIHGVIITSSKPYMIVCELMSNGDLRRHLHTIKIMGTLDQNEARAMLLSYSRQVASAMTYLSGKGYVHCDLATRNILLSMDGVCKISDFGLSRNLQDEDYYIAKNRVIPLRWTAPEAIQDGKFSAASDVWSYGVVLYEIWSLASKPYGSLTNEQVISQVLAGYRLPSPPGCPRAIYNKMIICWHPNATQRPTFIDLQISLQQPDYELLKWSEEDKATYSENARTIGAVLQEGQSLFKDIQHTYYECD